MTIKSHCFFAVFIAALIICVFAEPPPVVVTCKYMTLKEGYLEEYDKEFFEQTEQILYTPPEEVYSSEKEGREEEEGEEEEEEELPYIYPLFAGPSGNDEQYTQFVIENIGEEELSFVYSSSVANTTENWATLPGFTFEPVGGATSIPAGESLVFNLNFETEGYDSYDSFIGIFAACMVFKSATNTYDPISFRVNSKVDVPGCDDECESTGQGTCVDEIAYCNCHDKYTWSGVTCQTGAHIFESEVCPGVPIHVQYAFMHTTCAGYWAVYDVDEETYDSGPLYSDGCKKGSLVNETMTITTFLEPGEYSVWFYKEFGKTEADYVSFVVKDWSECGTDYSCAADKSGNVCSGVGSCTEAGKCNCTGSHFWNDCSRGCALETHLTARDGIIDSDSGENDENENPLYVQQTNCTWFIEPEGRGIDLINVEFSRFGFASGGDVLQVRTLTKDGGIDKSPAALLAKFSGTSIPQSKSFPHEKIALIFTTSYQGSSRGFRLKYSVITEPLSGGAIAGIVVAGFFVIAAIVAGLVFLWMRERKRREEALAYAKAAKSEPWNVSDVEEELLKNDRSIGKEGVMPEQSELEKMLGWYDMKEDLSFECDTYDLRFGLEDRMPCPVMVEQKQIFTISNSSDVPIAFCFFHPVDTYTIQCSIVPGKGTLAPGSGIHVEATLKLMYTTRVDTSIKCAVWRGARGPGAFYSFATSDGLTAPLPNSARLAEGEIDPEHAFQEALNKSKPLKSARLTIHLEGAVSERIDPGEVVLNPDPLGEGAYGVVYSGKYRGRFVAAKVMSRQHDLLEQITKDFEKEIDLYRRLHNPFIVEFVGASLIPGKLCMCTELIQRGSLEQLMSESEIPVALQLRFAMNVAEAVAFLHSNNIMYRDLKPSNIMVVSTSLNSKVNCKIGDFGTARNVKDVTEFYQYTQGQGTPVYMAPEMLAVKPYNCKADVYSFSITCWQMAAREKPWLNVPVWDIPTRVIHNKRPPMPTTIPKDYAEVIRKCWAPKPDDRPAFSDVVDMLGPIAKRTKKESKKDAKGKQHLAGAAASTVDFNMTLDESMKARDTLPDNTDTTTSTTTTNTATNPAPAPADNQEKKKKKKKKKKKVEDDE